MERIYRAAIVGLGNIAWRLDGGKDDVLTHAQAYLLHPRTKLVGGCSPVAADREQFAQRFGVPVYDGLDPLLDSLHPDIVSICSPTEFHGEHVLHCLGKEVPMIWLEKPPARSVGELDWLRAMKQALGGKSTIMVNYQRRHMETYQRLKDTYQKNLLGQCRLIHLHYSRGLETNGSHILDLLFYIAGDDTRWDLEWVSSFGLPENPCFSLRLVKGPGVMVSAAPLPYHCIDICLTCEEGRISALHGGMTLRLERRVAHELFPGFFRLKDEEDEVADSMDKRDLARSLSVALTDLLASHEAHRDPLSSLRTARNTVALIETVRHALAKRQGG